MTRTSIIIAAAVLLHATPVRAEETAAPAEASGSSYTFVDAMHYAIEGDGRASAVRGSVELGDTGVYLTAGQYRLRVEGERSSITSLGAGYHAAVSENTDFVIEATHDRHRWEGGGGRQASVAVGAYHTFSDTFEASVLLTRYFAQGDLAAADTVYVGGQRMLTANLALAADVEFGDGPAWYGVGLRYFIH